MSTQRTPRRKTMLMVTGDNGSLSWQKAPADTTANPDYLVAGGFISGPSQPAAVATELLLSLRETPIEIGYGVTYQFPQQGRKVLDVDKDEPDTLASPVYAPQPSEMDIVAALIYGIQLGSTSFTLNDRAHAVIEDYLVETGARTRDEIDQADTLLDNDSTTTVIY